MGIETDIHFIAESIEWQNKLLKKVFLEEDANNSSDESEYRNNESGSDELPAD